MMGWQWHQLDHMQVICTSLQRDNHASTSSLKFFYGPDALPAAQPTASKHWRQKQHLPFRNNYKCAISKGFQKTLKGPLDKPGNRTSVKLQSERMHSYVHMHESILNMRKLNTATSLYVLNSQKCTFKAKLQLQKDRVITRTCFL